MGSWYSVSFLGWLFTSAHTGLTAFVLHGLWTLPENSAEIEFFYGASYMYALLIAVLIYARFRKQKIFAAKK